MENEVKQEGITFGEVFRIIKRRLWYIIGAAVLFTVAAALLLEFVINPMLATYTMDFSLVFPTTGESAYPDGSPFYYQEMISADFLAEAKNSDEGLSRIDIEDMKRYDDIEIEADASVNAEEEGHTGRYTVTVRGSYFTGEEQAEDFIRALAAVPVKRMQEAAKNVNYASDKRVFESAPFEERLELLLGEKETLLSVYNSWIAAYSETYSVRITDSEGKVSVRRLKDFRDSVTALYGESVRRELENELEFGGYYYGDLDAYTAQLELEYQQNEAEIKRLEEVLQNTGSSSLAGSSSVRSAVAASSGESGGIIFESGDPDLSRRITSLITRNNRIDQWINVSGTVAKPTLTAEKVDAFAKRLSEEYEKLNSEANLLTEVITALYARGMSVRFDSQQVSSSGDIGTLVAAIVCLVVGFIVASAVTYFVESGKSKKQTAESTETDGKSDGKSAEKTAEKTVEETDGKTEEK